MFYCACVVFIKPKFADDGRTLFGNFRRVEYRLQIRSSDIRKLFRRIKRAISFLLYIFF